MSFFRSIIGGEGNLTKYLDCVIISHFHLDHCGALPHMTEQVGFDGPIYMTYPTKSIVPVLLVSFPYYHSIYLMVYFIGRLSQGSNGFQR